MSEKARTESLADAQMDLVDESEPSAEDEIGEDNAYVYTHRFSSPFNVDGTLVDELHFNWGNMTADDSLQIEREMQAQNIILLTPEFSGEYLIRMAVRACTTTIPAGVAEKRIGLDVFRRIPIRDYMKIRGRARSFLLRLGQ